MIIKVCGMRDPQNIQEVAALGVHWIGFIFYSKSPRRLTIMDNGQWIIDKEKKETIQTRKHPDHPIINYQSSIIHYKRVGVFVDATFEQMMEAVTTYGLDLLQLHGTESPDLCFALRKRGISLIKAFPVSSTQDIERTKEYEGYADYFLFDTRCESYGGSGKAFDWSILSAYRGNTPFLLSGGIKPDAVEAIESFRHPLFAGIDLNSGFETEPGFKDIEKLRAFLYQLRITNYELQINSHESH